MFITLYSYRAKPGQTEAIVSLYREWQVFLRDKYSALTELLSNPMDPTEMIMLARFKDEAAAWAAIESTDYRNLYSQLVHFAETGPIASQYVQTTNGRD